MGLLRVCNCALNAAFIPGQVLFVFKKAVVNKDFEGYRIGVCKSCKTTKGVRMTSFPISGNSKINGRGGALRVDLNRGLSMALCLLKKSSGMGGNIIPFSKK